MSKLHEATFEFGYTPANLNRLRTYIGISQKDTAKILNVHLTTYLCWEQPLNSSKHHSMNHKKWVEWCDWCRYLQYR